jgi:glycosyltransferase involved in cell wall biosynthesis
MRISVITVTFNSRECVEKTISSVLAQGYDELEYILIDGGSTDGTLDIIRSYAGRDPRIRWNSEPDRGIADAFNKGLLRATGEVIGIINADDEYMPGALEVVAREFAAHPGCDVLHGDMLRQEGDTPLFTLRPAPLDHRIWRQMPLNHPAMFVTRRAYERVGLFDMNLWIAMDYDLVLRLFRAGCHFRYLPQTLAIMRYGGASDDRFMAGLREVRAISVRNGFPRWKAAFWFCWNALKGHAKAVLRCAGLRRLLMLHPRFRQFHEREKKL